MARWVKYLPALFLLLCVAESASAQGTLIKDIAWRYTTSGIFPASGATITVCTSTASGSPCTPKVSLFSDAALSVPVTNPLPACSVSPQAGCIDGLGNWSAYVTPGGYTYSVSGAGLTAYGPVPIYASVISGGPASFSTLNGIRFADQFASIQAAINNFGGNCGIVMLAPFATYTGNITITNTTCTNSSNITLQGGGRRSTFLKPASNAAIITIDSTAGAVQSVNIRDIGFDNAGSGFTQSAITIQGANINDHHEFRRLFMSGFKNSLNIVGRTIWSVFDNIEMAGDTDIALNIVSSASPINFNKFHWITITGAAGAEGVLLSCTGTCGGQSLHIGNEFDGLDVEGGTGIGAVLNNTEGTQIRNPYFETNAGIQISAIGTFERALTIEGGYLNTPNNTVVISLTPTQLSGKITGVFIHNNAGGACTITQTTSGSGSSGMFIAGNDDIGPHCISPDANGTYHTSVYGSYAPVTVTASGSQTPSVAGINHLHYQNTVAATITNFLNGDPGQTLDVTNEGSSTVAFTHASSSGLFMINGQSVTLAAGQSCRFIFEPLNSRWMETSCTNGSFATLTGTENLSNKSLPSPVINGSPTGTGIATLTLKKGSGAGNYTTASTTYVVADSTNLCLTVTIPTGWKLSVSASGAIGTATAAVLANIALTDNAACGTANAGLLVESTETTTAAGVLQPFALNWVITGDGAAHNVALQYKTSAGADSATLLNASATQLPVMSFSLMPSN